MIGGSGLAHTRLARQPARLGDALPPRLAVAGEQRLPRGLHVVAPPQTQGRLFDLLGAADYTLVAKGEESLPPSRRRRARPSTLTNADRGGATRPGPRTRRLLMKKQLLTLALSEWV